MGVKKQATVSRKMCDAARKEAGWRRVFDWPAASRELYNGKARMMLAGMARALSSMRNDCNHH
jgi:hypothetical protein